MRSRISIRGNLRPSVRWSVRPSVTHELKAWLSAISNQNRDKLESESGKHDYLHYFKVVIVVNYK